MWRAIGLMLMGAGAVLAQRNDPGPGNHVDPRVEAALKEIVPLTSGVREDDHPAIASRGDVAWTAWVSYSESDDTTDIYAAVYRNGGWGSPQRVTLASGDYSKPAITIDGSGTVWVAWPAQVAHNWDIYGRVYRPGTGWGGIERWTTDVAPDLQPALASDHDRVMLVWQGFRKGDLDILYRLHESGAWRPEGFVTRNTANDWEPAVAASGTGDFHVVWDSYRGDYDVMLRTLHAGGQWSEERAVAQSARLENHASVSVDPRGRAWIAWEAGPEAWASDSPDGGLRPRRDIEIACLENGKLYRSTELDEALRKLAGKEGMQAPALFAGGDGRLRLFFRQPMNKNWLKVGLTVWDGSKWSKPDMVPYSEGRIDQRIVIAPVGSRILMEYPAGSTHNIVFVRPYEVGAAGGGETAVPLSLSEPPAKEAPAPRPVHTLKGYRVVFGDLHRHTDISEDGGIPDGSLIDTMRYAADAAGLDFIGITDHTRYLPRRYNLWRLKQIADLYYKPGAFSPLHAYERSQYSPWGHRNIVNLDRNYTPVPANYEIGDQGVSPWGLFAALKGKNAISIPHTSAWGSKQVSWDYYDPEVERLVEIYQGMRSTYEYNGAPDRAGEAVYEKDSKSFVWDALARKHRLGFIASSDHGSTHVSFAVVLARNIDRQSIFDSLRARRTYAATDKIFLDFTMGDHLMGEEVTAQGIPEFQVNVEGTAPVARIDIIKDGTFVYTSNPNTRTAKFAFRDQNFVGDESYYYVRIIQADKNMAWASPIWVKSSGRK
ncbi:MAG TPA: hypothetical protein VGL72_29630 [Bryobacteraceae bacterium]|jgi:hypothetical protein